MKNAIVCSIIITLLSLLTACAPGAAPPQAPLAATTPAPIAPGIPAINLASNLPPPTSEDAAWQKIVEAAKKEGKVTDYSYNFPGDIGIAINRAFKERYGIRVDIVTGRGADFIERVKTERRMGSIMADMSDGGAPYMAIMKNEGLTVGIAGELPVLREKDVWRADIFGMDPVDRNLIVYRFSTYSTYVNTNLVKPGEEPKVWRDLLDPRWKGKMILLEPIIQTGAYMMFVPLMREKVIDIEFIKDLYRQDLMFANSTSDEGRMLSLGERALSIYGTSASTRRISEGAPLRAIAFKDGTSMGVSVLVAYKGSPHPNAAKVFINWLLSPEGQTVYGKAASDEMARKDVPNFLPEAARVTPPHPIVITNEDNDEIAKLFRERWLNKLWGR
ncbi:MAG: extracellular solute-binding protein [Chloroflexota bacterium]